jgi:uncharacterized protein (DUF2267 family)
MTDEEFVNAVARRTGVSTQQAESLARATLSALSDRLTAGEADDVASQLPKSLEEAMIPSTPEAEAFDLEESSTGSVVALEFRPTKPRSEPGP